MRNDLLEKKEEKERKRREILMKEREKELKKLKRLKEEEKIEQEFLKEKRRKLKKILKKKKAVKQKIPFFKIFKKEKLPPLPPLPKELFIKTGKLKIKSPTIKKPLEPVEEIESKREIEEAIEKVKQRPAKLKLSVIQFIKNGIYDARDALTDLDLKRARHIYIEIMAHYNELKDKDKARVYEDIKELYEDRKHAESIFGK